MTKTKGRFHKVQGAFIFSIVLLLVEANLATAQGRFPGGSRAALEIGTQIPIRNTGEITATNQRGQLFHGVVEQDVLNAGGVVIPKGSNVELALRDSSNNGIALHLNAVEINGTRLDLKTEVNQIRASGRGRRFLPAQSLLIFHLQEPLRLRADSSAYRAGLQAGRSDADRNLRRNTQSASWSTPQQRRDYEAGYNDGYRSLPKQGESAVQDSETTVSKRANAQQYERAVLTIGADNNIRWQASENARVLVQVDNEPFKLFAEGRTGIQSAPWMGPGHRYLFVLQDLNGNEIARDLRGR